jgi:hypothetical protein
VSEVKRWEIPPTYMEQGVIREKADGYWVAFEDFDALRAQLDEARAMRAAEHDDTHSRIEKLHAELVEARADITRLREGCIKAWSERDALRAAIEAHNQRCSDLEACGAQTRPEHMVIPLPPAASAGAYPTHHHRHACPALYGEACACDAMPIDRGEASAETKFPPGFYTHCTTHGTFPNHTTCPRCAGQQQSIAPGDKP